MTAYEGEAGAIELSVVMPCLNEVRTLGTCIGKAQGCLTRLGVAGEIIVADNGSSDGSQALAASLGARVIPVPRRGYGAALRAGFEAARGTYLVMGDSDDSYDFSSLGPFLERLRAGDDLVMGNRFRGGIAPGAMPPWHQYFGNPMLSLFARIFFRVPIGDVYCGLRGLTKATFVQLDLQSSGMEFALEMIVKARLMGLRIAEVPTTLSPDGRDRAPHLNTWRDGRRSLLLYLASMPSGFLLYPGLALMTLGVVVGARLAIGPLTVSGVHFDVHSLIYCGAAVLLGFQLAAYSVAIRFLMLTSKLLPPQMGYGWAAGLKLEQGLGLGLAFIVAGLVGVFWLLNVWRSDAFGNLDPFVAMRIAIPSATAITLGLQVSFAALFMSLAKWQVRTRASG